MRFDWRHPTRLVPLAFFATILIGTMLLSLPVARVGAGGAPLITALFTSTSAVAVTGLITVDTPTYWTGFGQAVILCLFQIGGFGVMTAATLLGLVAGRGIRLRQRLLTSTERSRIERGDVASVLKLVLVITLIVELLLAAWLAVRLHTEHGEPLGQAAWNGLFHAVSAFNNAGFSTYSDSLMGLNSDALFLVPIMLAIVVSALGFPVFQDVREFGGRWDRYSLHSKITISGTILLLFLGFANMAIAEWNNPGTLGPMDTGAKLLNAAFHSVTPRTAGFNSIDMGAMNMEALAVTSLLMFIGGGSAGTAGGIKITTFFLLGIITWSEIRGQRDATVFGRRVGQHIERQALALVLLALAMIGIATIAILGMTRLQLHEVLFETVSAFATVGLSTGITADLPPLALLILIVLMFVGRVGTITIATALALGAGRVPYRYPEEEPIIG